jgi:FAD/FMN-containing dehydrogenase
VNDQNTAAAAVARGLASRLDYGAVVRSGPAYEETRRIWNGAVTSRPAVVVRARTIRDVQVAVRVATRHGLPLSVRSGGHDWAGRSLRDGGLVIDLTGMDQVTAHPERCVATVGGGATAAAVIAAAEPYGLTAVTGTVGSVGMAGLTLGGGYGLLNGHFGLAADNLLGADVVLADGRAVSVDDETEPELFWAIRGGGGNFGIVTSMRIRLHAVRAVLAGVIGYQLREAASVLERLAEILADAPDELTVQGVILTGPDGAPGLFLSPLWSGDLAAGESRIRQLERLGTQVFAQVDRMTYGEAVHRNDAQGELTGNHVTARTLWLPRYTEGVAAGLTEAGRTVTSALSGVVVHDFHGAAARVPVQSTAFGLRRPHLMVEVIGWWPPGPAAPHEAWADNTARALAPDALPGGYPNMLGPAREAQIAQAYGPNTARLLAAKERFDPQGVFSATPLPAVRTSA